jgi:hypothetical protein
MESVCLNCQSERASAAARGLRLSIGRGVTCQAGIEQHRVCEKAFAPPIHVKKRGSRCAGSVGQTTPLLGSRVHFSPCRIPATVMIFPFCRQTGNAGRHDPAAHQSRCSWLSLATGAMAFAEVLNEIAKLVARFGRYRQLRSTAPAARHDSYASLASPTRQAATSPVGATNPIEMGGLVASDRTQLLGAGFAALAIGHELVGNLLTFV